MTKLCMGCMSGYDADDDACPICGYVEGGGDINESYLVPGSMLRDRYIVGAATEINRDISIDVNDTGSDHVLCDDSGGFVGKDSYNIDAGAAYAYYSGYDLFKDRPVSVREYLPLDLCRRKPGRTKIKIYGGEKFNDFQNGLDEFIDEARLLTQSFVSGSKSIIYDSFKENNTVYIISEPLNLPRQYGDAGRPAPVLNPAQAPVLRRARAQDAGRGTARVAPNARRRAALFIAGALVLASCVFFASQKFTSRLLSNAGETDYYATSSPTLIVYDDSTPGGAAPGDAIILVSNTTGQITTEPIITGPTMIEPLTTEPVTAKPTASESVTTEPITAEPFTTEPIIAGPITTEPFSTEPITAGLTTTEPITTERLTTERLTTERLTTERLTTEPITTERLTTEPLTTEPLTTEPLTTEPLTTEPLTTELLTTPDAPLRTAKLSIAPNALKYSANVGDYIDMKFSVSIPKDLTVTVNGAQYNLSDYDRLIFWLGFYENGKTPWIELFGTFVNTGSDTLIEFTLMPDMIKDTGAGTHKIGMALFLPELYTHGYNIEATGIFIKYLIVTLTEPIVEPS